MWLHTCTVPWDHGLLLLYRHTLLPPVRHHGWTHIVAVKKDRIEVHTHTHTSTHLSLHHVASTVPHLSYKWEDINSCFTCNTLQLWVKCDESTRPSHPCTAVDHNGTSILLISSKHTTSKSQHWSRMFWNTKVGPGCIMKLFNYPLLFRTTLNKKIIKLLHKLHSTYSL